MFDTLQNYTCDQELTENFHLQWIRSVDELNQFFGYIVSGPTI